MLMLRLPFPLVALEVPFPPAGNLILIKDGPLKESLSTKRIALAWDESFAAMSGVSPDHGEPGVYVTSVYFEDSERPWFITPGGVFVPHANDPRIVSDRASDENEALTPGRFA